MAIGWNFPSSNFGTLNGIGEAGIETFKGTPYKSLAREICQNSLDAKDGSGKPVIVEFFCSKEDLCSFHDYATLSNAIDSCLSFWKKNNNKKTVDFFDKAQKVAAQKTLSVLRISDFNTTGLTGSDKDYNTPWQNLVKASGVSDKGDDEGGSFGIGKSAPFACSNLRTVFYATEDINGLCASQGVARLVSFPVKKGLIFQKDSDDITTGIGYYGEKLKNQSIRECCSFQKGFMRTVPGTDVYILGYMDKKGWEDEIIASVLDDFLISIFYGTLEVRVGKVEISQRTLGTVVEVFKEKAVSAYNYYQAMTSKEAHVIKTDFNGLGDIELHLLIQKDLHRRVLMGRSNGMKVFDQKNFPSSIQFAGVCILQGKDVNSFFREMENPQHNEWQPERHHQLSLARKYKKDLFQLIKGYVLEYGRKTTVDEIDAEGVGEYLPDDIAVADGQDKHESIVDTTKSIDISTPELKSYQKGFEMAASVAHTSAEDADGVPEGEDFGEGGNKDFADDEPNQTTGGNAFGSNPGGGTGTASAGDESYTVGTEGVPETAVKKKYEIRTMAVRLMLVDAQKKRYRLIFVPEKTSGKGYLQLKLSGEQSDIAVNILLANNRNTGENLKTSQNIIFLRDIQAKRKMTVEFNVAFSECSSMEVSLYGYKV